MKVWSTKSINEYISIKTHEKDSNKFDFTVREIEFGKLVGKLYAEIDGFNNDDDFTSLM